MGATINYEPVYATYMLDVHGNGERNTWDTLIAVFSEDSPNSMTLSKTDQCYLEAMHKASGKSSSVWSELYDLIERHGTIRLEITY
jgi:hypothetical protein